MLQIDVALDLLDDTGIPIADLNVKINLSLVSDSAQDTMGRVDAAISRLDDSLFLKIPKFNNDASAIMATGANSSVEAVVSCIPSLGQAFEAVMKIARTFSDVRPSHFFVSLSSTPSVSQAPPILNVSCMVLFSVYEVRIPVL